MAGWGLYDGLQRLMGDGGFLLSLFQLTVAGGGGLAVFALVVTRMGLSEVDLFVDRLRAKFGKAR